MRRIICYYHFFTPLGFVVPEGCWGGRASHSSAFSSPWSHCWPSSLTQSSLGCVWWGDSGTDWLFLRTSFLPHLLQLGVGNGYRSLWFRVQYLKWQMKFYYFILESSGFVFSKLSNQTQLAINTEAGSLHWVECLGLLPEALGKFRYSPGGSLVSMDCSRASSLQS